MSSGTTVTARAPSAGLTLARSAGMGFLEGCVDGLSILSAGARRRGDLERATVQFETVSAARLGDAMRLLRVLEGAGRDPTRDQLDRAQGTLLDLLTGAA